MILFYCEPRDQESRIYLMRNWSLPLKEESFQFYVIISMLNLKEPSKPLGSETAEGTVENTNIALSSS